MVEQYGFLVLVLGAILGGIAWLWLIVRAFRTRVWWGLGGVAFPPLVLVFAALHFRKASAPLLLLLLGVLLVGGTFGVNYVLSHHVDLGPRDKLVDGERHLTLTGWDGTDYSVVQARPDTVVLQLANPDVTDATLAYLQTLRQLRELDVNDTQVTDGGLERLSQLPALQILRLRGTKITDAGFRQYLDGKDTLLELDLRGTEVASKTLRAWKARQPERRRYLR